MATQTGKPEDKTMAELTHFNQDGKVHMVDVGSKDSTQRTAVTSGWISMQPATLEKVRSGSHKKGDVLGIARIAGIMAAKRTPDLIPLCHPLMLTHVDLKFTINDTENRIHCQCTVETHGQTGVEMEALTATQVALLTIYDMCKAVDRGMLMGGIGLLEKKGGKSGHWQRS